MSTVRLLSWQCASGSWNMAADEALLASASSGVASLRFYGWTEPTLSLGYFQSHITARAVSELSPLAWVRRPSGGMALVHHHEVTYALALPTGPGWQPAGESWLIRMHEVIREALAELGVAARLCPDPLSRGEVLCFLHHTPGDLLIGECKVAGSAQRKQRGAMMQHGSILLRQSPHTPALPGIAELTGRNISEEMLISAILASLTRQLGWSFTSEAWTDEEMQLIETVRDSRYRTAAWNEKR